MLTAGCAAVVGAPAIAAPGAAQHRSLSQAHAGNVPRDFSFVDDTPLTPGPRPAGATPLKPALKTSPVAVGRGHVRFVVRPRRRPRGRAVPFHVAAGTVAELEQARRDARNVWAEPAYPVAATLAPNDPLYPSQAEDFTSAGDDGFRAAWEVTTGRPPLGGEPPIIAIVDSGVDVGHADLKPNLWTNPGEIAGNGRDDDKNGYVDDIHGADIISPGSPPDDEYYHGTAVAGVAAARGDDGRGVTGVAWVARIMAVRVLDADGVGDTSQLAEGILYAVANGARVINVSVTSGIRTKVIDEALATATRAGALVVTAAGNGGSDLARDPVYPASNPSPAVISVAATEQRGVLADWSNYGRSGVDIAAPGSNLLTTLVGDSYAAFSGTSAAAPLVTGTVALMHAAQPHASAAQLRATLLETAARTSVPVRSGELRAGSALSAMAPLDIGIRTLATPDVPYVTIRTLVTDGVRLRHRVAVRWTVRRSARTAHFARLSIRRRWAGGAMLWRHTRTVTGFSGSITATKINSLLNRPKAEVVIEVRVISRNGTALGTGREVLALDAPPRPRSFVRDGWFYREAPDGRVLRIRRASSQL